MVEQGYDSIEAKLTEKHFMKIQNLVAVDGSTIKQIVKLINDFASDLGEEMLLKFERILEEEILEDFDVALARDRETIQDYPCYLQNAFNVILATGLVRILLKDFLDYFDYLFFQVYLHLVYFVHSFEQHLDGIGWVVFSTLEHHQKHLQQPNCCIQFIKGDSLTHQNGNQLFIGV